MVPILFPGLCQTAPEGCRFECYEKGNRAWKVLNGNNPWLCDIRSNFTRIASQKGINEKYVHLCVCIYIYVLILLYIHMCVYGDIYIYNFLSWKVQIWYMIGFLQSYISSEWASHLTILCLKVRQLIQTTLQLNTSLFSLACSKYKPMWFANLHNIFWQADSEVFLGDLLLFAKQNGRQ